VIHDLILILIGAVIGLPIFSWVLSDYRKMFGGNMYYSIKDIKNALYSVLVEGNEENEDIAFYLNSLEGELRKETK
jgi:hypothetical protein